MRLTPPLCKDPFIKTVTHIRQEFCFSSSANLCDTEFARVPTSHTAIIVLPCLVAFSPQRYLALFCRILTTKLSCPVLSHSHHNFILPCFVSDVPHEHNRWFVVIAAIGIAINIIGVTLFADTHGYVQALMCGHTPNVPLGALRWFVVCRTSCSTLV